MKVAIATHKDWSQVSGHAGQAREWLLFDCQPGAPNRADRSSVGPQIQNAC